MLFSESSHINPAQFTKNPWILLINFTYVLSLFMCIQRLTLPEVSPIISFSTSSTETLL